MTTTVPRVLVVEDDENDAVLVQRALDASRRPFTRERVTRVSAALERLARGGIDVVLLDLALPDAQGFEAIHRIGADHPFVPVVVLTGLDDEEVGLKAVQMERKRAEQALARWRRSWAGSATTAAASSSRR